MRALITAAAAFGICAGGLAMASSPANACGGFFCSQVPIDQMGEQIIFGIDGTTITAQIQIAYTGEAKDFAWVLPVAAKPELSVGSQQAFNTVLAMTAPNYWLDWQGEGNQCGQWRWLQPGVAEDFSAAGGDTDEDGVTVVETKEVGPYDTVILEANDASKLVEWLNDNGFDQPDESTPLIQHYVDANMLFVGLKLRQNEGVGAIQPITLKIEEADPCVPLILTQIAAVPDMPVRLYLLGEHRTVPTNWMHVVINEKKIDWLNYGQNYVDVVTQAVNEAVGHGFVTEYAGTSGLMDGAIYNENRYNLSRLGSIDDPAQFVRELLNQGFPRDATMQGLLRKHIPMPQSLVDQGVDERSFYNNLNNWATELADLSFDPAAFVTDLEERVITPLRETQEIFDDHPYLTRLFTTVSPDEMTRDPLFAMNPDLGDVPNQHTAIAESVCDDDDPNQLDKVIITLDNGDVFEVDATNWWNGGEIPDPAPTEPAARRIELIGRTGPPVLVDPSQVAQVDQLLDSQTPESVIKDLQDNVIPVVVTPPTITGDGNGQSGCQAGGTLPLALLLGLGGSALLLFRRRRRTR